MIELDATALSRKVTGNDKATNFVILGVLVALGILPIRTDTVREVIEETTGRFAPEDTEAFEAGVEMGEQMEGVRLGEL